MRTTIRLQDALLQEAKKKALELHISLTALIEEALQDKLYKSNDAVDKDFSLPTFSGSGLHPGVDINNAQDLLDLMEGLR